MAISLRAVSAASEGTDTSVEILMPSGITQDDILVACVNANSDGATAFTFSWPAGWTVLNAVSGTGLIGVAYTRIEVGWKKFNTGDGTQTVTVSSPLSAGGWVVQCAAYSGVDLTTPVLGNGITGSVSSTSSSSSLTTPTATDSTSGVWRVSFFAGSLLAGDSTWGSYSPADTERGDNTTGAATYRPNLAMADSNAEVDASGGTSVTATPSAAVYTRVAWIGLLKPVAKVVVRGFFVTQQAINRASLW